MFTYRLNSRIIVQALFGCILLISAYTAQSQKVGVVLSGGGAKGVAHIGVLRALEEERIPIHYIAGTSMGAIIGGLYAIGWTTEQMEKVILSEDFMNWSTGALSDEYKFYFKKPTPNASWLSLRLKVDSIIQPQFPVNIVSPVQMDFVFLELFAAAAAAANYNFDSLFIPFRCMASDIEDNKSVTLKNGDLGSAIRASMTFPFYFRPIRIDGKLLFDGGMYDNFPVEVMFRDFFPDMIIGSKTAGTFGVVKDDNVLSHLEAMLTEATSYTIPCENGVLIKPQLKQVNVNDFSHTKAFIDSGYMAAKRSISEIRAYVYDTVSSEKLNEQRRLYRSGLPDLFIDSIYIKGLTDNQAIYVNRMLKQGEVHIPLRKVKMEYFKMMADGRFDHIYPQLRYVDSTGLFDLHLDSRRDNNVVVEFGGNISSSPINNAYVGIKYNLLGLNATTLSANSYVGRFYSSAHLAARIDFSATTPLFFEPSVTFSRWDFFKTSTYFFEDVTPSYLIQNETSWLLQMGVPIGNRAKLVWGYNQARLKDEYYQTNFFTRVDTADQTQLIIASPFVFYEKNTLNNKQYPWRGEYLLSSMRYISGNETHNPGSTAPVRTKISDKHGWWQLKVQYQRFFRAASFYWLGFSSEMVASNQPMLSNYTSTMLAAPAFHPVPESKTRFLPEYRAHNYLALGMNNIFIIRKNLDFRVGGYLFTPFQEIVQDENFRAMYKSPLRHASLIGSISLIYHTPIGPISLKYSYFNDAEDPEFLMLNLGYIIFNPRALH